MDRLDQRYIVDHPVGQGGMGAVYRARDTTLDRPVALKVMLPEEAADEESVARFLREARLAAALEHPGIVRIYEVGTSDGKPFIAMEWIEGTTLRRAKLPDPRATLHAIAEILAFAHEHGVIHRDLKPGNVMIDVHGKPKLVDFGIAKRMTSVTFATRDGVVLGTPRYMAPEQELTSAVDARADQYAWGVMAYELLTGEVPLRPALAHAALEPRDAEVILRALAPSPKDRFASMRDLLAAWTAKTAKPVEVPPTTTPRSPARAFAVSVLAAMVLAGAVTLAVVARSKPKPIAVTVADASSVEETAEEPIASASASAPAPLESAAPSSAPVHTARIAKTVSIYSSGAMDIERDEITAGLKPILQELKRCIVGAPLSTRPDEQEFVVRIWLKDDGIASGTTAIRTGNDPLSTWPGAAARKCVDRAIVGRRFNVGGGGATFLLTFYPK